MERKQYHREYMRKRRLEKGDLLRAQERDRYHRDPQKARAKLAEKRGATRQWLRDIKLASGCVDCSFRAHPDALHFDHLPQFEKKFHVGRQMGGYGRELILAEINKCEVRCANCHAIKTALRRLNG